LGDFALGLVGGVFDFGLEAFEEALEEGGGVDGFLAGLELVGEGDVAGEVGEDDAPGEGILPSAGAKADVLALLGHPDAKDFEGGFVADCGGRDFEVLGGWHDAGLRRFGGSGLENVDL
jgi:hypothetical protein